MTVQGTIHQDAADVQVSIQLEAPSDKACELTASQAALKDACGLSPEEVAAMRRVWAIITCADKPEEEHKEVVRGLSIAVFELLFERHPQLLDMFPTFKGSNNKPVTARMESHAVRVVTTLGKLLGMLNDFPTLAETTLKLVQRHVGYKVTLEMYDQVLGVVADFLHMGLSGAGLWDDVQAAAWPKLVGLIKSVAAGVYDHTA